jgi:hypothetical protein
MILPETLWPRIRYLALKILLRVSIIADSGEVRA